MDASLFDKIDRAHKSATAKVGCPVSYFFANGTPPVRTNVVLDDDWQIQPVSYETQVQTPITQALVLKCDVPDPCAGDWIVVPTGPQYRPYEGLTLDVEHSIETNDPWATCVVLCRR